MNDKTIDDQNKEYAPHVLYHRDGEMTPQGWTKTKMVRSAKELAELNPDEWADTPAAFMEPKPKKAESVKATEKLPESKKADLPKEK